MIYDIREIVGHEESPVAVSRLSAGGPAGRGRPAGGARENLGFFGLFESRVVPFLRRAAALLDNLGINIYDTFQKIRSRRK